MDRAALSETLSRSGVPAKQLSMRTNQVWHWLYHRGAESFDEMLNLSKDLRATLDQKCAIEMPEIVEEQVSQDGTRKWLLRFPARGSGAPVEVESVYIPERDRGTLCVSSQVGCSLTCCLLYTSPSPRDATLSRMPSSA